MTKTEKLIDTIARLNPDAGEIGAGMLANIVAEAKAIQAEKPSLDYSDSELYEDAEASERVCTGCYNRNCNGECSGDDMMGSSS